MDHDKPRESKRLGRRRFVRAATSLGIVAASLRLGTRDGVVRAAEDEDSEDDLYYSDDS